MAGAESLAELKHSARLGKTFPVGWVAGWLRKAENKAKDQHSWRLGLAELGKKEILLGQLVQPFRISKEVGKNVCSPKVNIISTSWESGSLYHLPLNPGVLAICFS